ncbi:isochorismatase hydrolase [Nitzschia inconspicua]|uniref:Isochorismatase hydrolase n=1 Tax=Nitzschia inconspicua TaxID=303405 RepID=A0A9K3KEP4_9STRA|nr:isochorismatase hydrolase [Nitzschia inconspicua]
MNTNIQGNSISFVQQRRDDIANEKLELFQPTDLSISHIDRPSTCKYSAASTALVVVDVQPEYWSYCPEVRKDFPNFPRNISRTISSCRKQGVPIIWIRADYRYNCSPWLRQFERLRGEGNAGQIPYNSASPSDVEWEDFARPMENEIVIPKHSFSAASKTALLDVLKAANIQTVLVCGLITSVCVHHSCYSIFEAGFQVILVEDSCADRGIERHKAVIELYGDYMYDVISSNDLKFNDPVLVSDKLFWITSRNLGDRHRDDGSTSNCLDEDECSHSMSRSTSRTASLESFSSLCDRVM